MQRNELGAIEEHLRKLGWTYLGAGPNSRVHLRRSGQEFRPASRIYRFHLAGSGRHLDVIAKVALARGSPSAPTSSERPRLVTAAGSGEKAAFEFATLQEVARTFASQADERFGWVRPLAHLPASGALLLVQEPARDLRGLIRSGFMLRPSSRRRALVALERAGAWLRIFHAIPLTHARERLASRESVAELLDRLAEYLGARVTQPGGVGELLGRGSAAARSVLPERLTPGLVHGDLAPRNILVGSDGRVMLIDTLGRWRTSVLEDLAYALVGLSASPTPVLLAPRATLEWPRRCGEALLRGYFGDENIPRSSIALYETLVLADRWAAAVERRLAGGARAGKVDALIDRAYLRRASRYLRQAQSGDG